MSLRVASTWAGIADIAQLKDTSLLDRLRNASDWFGEIVRSLLSARVKPSELKYIGRTIRLIDGTTLSEPGSKGTNWRIHAMYDLASGSFSHLKVTDQHTAESLMHGPIDAGEIIIADRGYAKAQGLSSVVKHRADFIVRIGWRSLRLFNIDGTPLDLFDSLASVPQDGQIDIPVTIASSRKEPRLSARLILLAKPDEAAEKARAQIKSRGSKKQCSTDPRSVVAAGYVMIITSLDTDTFSAEEIAALYRFRWQIELAFKRLKSTLHIDKLRAFDPDLAKTWIYAHLIAAIVIDSMTQEILESPPCGP
jgi:hypothetical protein